MISDSGLLLHTGDPHTSRAYLKTSCVTVEAFWNSGYNSQCVKNISKDDASLIALFKDIRVAVVQSFAAIISPDY
jgi:hypothetical protein